MTNVAILAALALAALVVIFSIGALVQLYESVGLRRTLIYSALGVGALVAAVLSLIFPVVGWIALAAVILAVAGRD